MRDIIAARGNLLKRGADSAAALDQISQKNQIFHSEPMCDLPSDYIVLFRCGCCSLSSAEVGLACAYRERSQRCAYSSAVMGDVLFHATVLRVSCRKEVCPVDAYAGHNCRILADLMYAKLHVALARGLRRKFWLKTWW